MPRVTRAALRSNAATLEEMEGAASVPLPLTPRKERAPLSEVTGNTVEPMIDNSNSNNPEPKKKRTAKSKQRQVTRKAKKAGHVEEEEILDDDNQSATSSAVEDACEALRKDPEGSPQVVLDDETLGSSASAEKPTSHKMAHPDSTQNHLSISDKQNCIDSQHEHQADDSFVKVIETRTPMKILQAGTPLPLEEMTEKDDIGTHDTAIAPSSDQSEAKDDSFVAQIVTRSPVKPALRIEDSVEAIDAFEDEIEKVGEQLPAIENAVSSAKAEKQHPVTRSSPRNSRAAKIAPTAKSKAVTRQSTSRLHHGNTNHVTNPSSMVEQDSNRSRVTPRVSSIHKAPFQPKKSTKPPTTSTFELPGDAVARKLKEQRDARLALEGEGQAKPQKMEAKPVKPVKSTKPPTRASFELPGEAVARKLKEKREERLKQQEGNEAEPKRKDFKARPVSLSKAPVVKPTATSRARLSLAQGGGLENQKPRTSMASTRAAASGRRPVSLAPSDVRKRQSILSVAKRTSTAIINAPSRPSLADATNSCMSIATPSQRTTSNGKAAHQTVRGKAVFERNKSAKDELEKARKEKEEAAKRARVEAAERGRIASRQWAEKQKARKASTEKVSGEGQVAATAA